MKKSLRQIYKNLFDYFGPQHWWPADSAFEVVIGAILTQNTSWKNVEKAISNLKKERLLSAKKLYSLPPKKMAKLIKPAGYFNIKTKRLRCFLEVLFSSYDGNLNRMLSLATPKLRRRLLEIKGIGPETADSILLYAAKRPVFVVDAYTQRIFRRKAMIGPDYSYDQVQDLFMRNLDRNTRLFNEYHALLVSLGKWICSKNNPRCDICPIRNKSKKCKDDQ